MPHFVLQLAQDAGLRQPERQLRQHGKRRQGKREPGAQQRQREEQCIPAEEPRHSGEQRAHQGAREQRRRTGDRHAGEDAHQLEQWPRRLLAQLQQRAQPRDQQAGGARAQIGRALPPGGKALGADLVRDHVQKRARRHRRGDGQESALAEAGNDRAQHRSQHARSTDDRRAHARRARPAQIEKGQHHRRGERRMVRDQRDLQIELPARLRQRRDQRQPFGDRVEDQRRESDLGGDAHPGEPARLEQTGAEGARARLQDPGQRESQSHPEQRGEALRGENFGEQVERDHAGRRGESKGAGPLQHRRPLAREQRDGAAEQRGKQRQPRGQDHASSWQSRQRPRNSSRCPRTR